MAVQKKAKPKKTNKSTDTVRIRMMLSEDVLEHFISMGPDWEKQMNRHLQKSIKEGRV